MTTFAHDKRVIWRRIGTVLLIALPLGFFLPGIGLDTSHPASLARQSAPVGTWFYRVRHQDVLTRIAERELGTMHRYDEILALNPGIKPRALTVGSVLKMPPKAASLPGGAAPAPPAPPGAALEVPEQSPKRLLLAFGALLVLVVIVVAVAGRLERRAHLS